MKILLSSLLIMLSISSFGQTEQLHPIDRELQDCLNSDENSTTVGMTECINTATWKWGEELNRQYKILLSLLTDQQKERLKSTQREWIRFRDKELQFTSQLYSDMQGTMWIPVAAQVKLDLIKHRTLELKNYTADLTAGKL